MSATRKAEEISEILSRKTSLRGGSAGLLAIKSLTYTPENATMKTIANTKTGKEFSTQFQITSLGSGNALTLA
jgi:hypothetical protein